MEKVERIKSILRGEDQKRLSYSFWTHFPLIDLDAQSLAETTYGFYKELDLDFVKSMPNGMFSIQDWGCECDFSQIPHGGVAGITKAAVEAPADWGRLEELDVEKGSLGRELASLNLLLRLMKVEAPVIATVFSPMTTAYKLSEGRVLDHLLTAPEQVKPALDIITGTTRRFAQKAVELGCAGIFLATQLCTADMFPPGGYSRYCRAYDLELLEAVGKQTWFNVVHVHGNRILFDEVADYPVEALSWHIWETPPTVETFLNQTHGKAILGGLQRNLITSGQREALARDLENMVRATNGKRLILGPGCTIRHPCDRDLLKAIVSNIRQYNWNVR